MNDPLRFRPVDRRARLSVREFKREYQVAGKPVIIPDAIESWNARSSWTFDYFKSRYGQARLLVYRYDNDKYRPENVSHMRLADYIDGVSSNDWHSFPWYVRDNWALLTEYPELSADYTYPQYFFDWFSRLPSFLRLRYPRVFIGPKGAVTPLHRDIWGTHAWLSQLVGRKRWILFSREEAKLLYNNEVNPDSPDFKRFPLLRHTHPYECVLSPGETIFVPGGWPHYVVSLDPTISLTSNYMGPGCFSPVLMNVMREQLFKRTWNAVIGRASRLLQSRGVAS